VGEADLKEVLPPYLARWKWPHTLDDFLVCWFEAESEIDQSLAEFIQAQRDAGIPCYLATNQEKYRARYMRTHMGLDTLFDRIFASAHLGVCKPQPAFYAAVTQAIGVAPEQIMFWDDTPAHVEAARAFGWQAELYKGGE
jgi:putative hydrolase of the HAD superfamily